MFQAKLNASLQTNFTRDTLAPHASSNAATPLKPPGVFLPDANYSTVAGASLTKPPGVLKRTDSCHSLASTAATSAGASEDDKQDPNSLIVPPAVKADIAQCSNRELQVEHMDDGSKKVFWPLNVKKLNGKDQQIVSPSFEIAPGSSFKLIVRPRFMGSKKGQTGFKKARGCGSVDLKRLSGTATGPKLRFCISVGGGAPFGPVEHDFSSSSVGGLASNDNKFDFKSAADSSSSTTLICLEVLPENH